MIFSEEENPQLTQLNEMLVKALPSLPTNVENSIYYARIKQLLHPEIFKFCKEQLELKEDLNFLRLSVGEPMTESEIRDYLTKLQLKYQDSENVGILWHIEITRIDFGVPVFCTIKRRNEILIKKFVFRFRKLDQESGLGDLSNSQILSTSIKTDKEKKKSVFTDLL